MWIKKQQERLMAERTALWRKTAVLIFLSLIAFCDFFFAQSNWQPHPAVKILLALVALVCFAIVFKRWRALKVRSVAICEGCGSVKADDGNMDCSCSSRFVPLAEMEWVEPSQAAEMKNCASI
jgi:hypothetical protein